MLKKGVGSVAIISYIFLVFLLMPTASSRIGEYENTGTSFFWSKKIQSSEKEG